MNPTKLELQHICGYLPYGLKALIEDIKDETKIIDIVDTISTEIVTFIKSPDWYFDTDENDTIFQPILNRIEDMSKEQLNELDTIRINKCSSGIDFLIKGSEFYYKHKFDIHNLIDAGLAVDAKTINTHTNA